HDLVTAALGAKQPEPVAQHGKQGLGAVDVDFLLYRVHLEDGHASSRTARSSRRGITMRRYSALARTSSTGSASPARISPAVRTAAASAKRAESRALASSLQIGRGPQPPTAIDTLSPCEA